MACKRHQFAKVIDQPIIVIRIEIKKLMNKEVKLLWSEAGFLSIFHGIWGWLFLKFSWNMRVKISYKSWDFEAGHFLSTFLIFWQISAWFLIKQVLIKNTECNPWQRLKAPSPLSPVGTPCIQYWVPIGLFHWNGSWYPPLSWTSHPPQIPAIQFKYLPPTSNTCHPVQFLICQYF